MDSQQHIEHISALSQPDGPLAPDGPSATIKNRAWFRQLPSGQYRPTDARAQLHDQLLAAERNTTPNVQQQRKAIVLAGPPGAGKSTVLEHLLGADKDRYRVLDADKFKSALLETALQDGSYENWIKPTAVKQLESEGAQFYPLELASLVHEESSMLMKTLRDESIASGDNIVIDSVLSNESKAVALGETLERAGYSVEVVDVEVPFEISQQQIQQRWQHSRQAAERGDHDLGGRWVPSEFARDVFNGPDGKSKPEHAAAQLAQQCPAVHRYRLFRRTQELSNTESGPKVEHDFSRLPGASSMIQTELAKTHNRVRSYQTPMKAPHRKPRPDKGLGM